MKAFVIAENEAAARELCAGARKFADEVVLCAVGDAAVLGVADKCLHINVPADAIVDDAYVTVNSIFDSENADLIFAEQSTHVLSLVGRLAAHVQGAAIVGVTALEADIARTMYFGGAGVREAKAAGNIDIYVMNAGVFEGEATGTDVVEEVSFVAPEHAIKKLSEEELPKSDVNLNAAEIIVGCGRGFAEETDLNMARDLASKVNAELGCTRPLAEGVDWFPREAYIGVSGQIVKPKAYIALGISGQMQHMVGVNEADTIIAVNKDKNAPIFKQCDFGIVGNISEVLPVLNAAF